jgi:hypothetical protein
MSQREKAKVAEAERVLREQLDAWEERVKKEDEAQEGAKKAGKVKDGERKGFNPFEGKPLNKDFPKTPMNFYNGEVVQRAPKVSDRHTSKTAKEVEERRSTPKAPEVIVSDDEPANTPKGEDKDRVKQSNIGMMLNDDAKDDWEWYD